MTDLLDKFAEHFHLLHDMPPTSQSLRPCLSVQIGSPHDSAQSVFRAPFAVLLIMKRFITFNQLRPLCGIMISLLLLQASKCEGGVLEGGA